MIFIDKNESAKVLFNDFYTNNGKLIVNRRFVKRAGLCEAVIFTELMQQEIDAEEAGEIYDEDWFSCEQKKITDDIGLSVEEQKLVIEKMIKLKMIETTENFEGDLFFKLNYGFFETDK
jgi:hypothetical protein